MLQSWLGEKAILNDMSQVRLPPLSFVTESKIAMKWSIDVEYMTETVQRFKLLCLEYLAASSVGAFHNLAHYCSISSLIMAWGSVR